MARYLIVTGDTGEGLEIYYCLYRAREDGSEAHVAGPSRQVIRSVVHDFEPGWDTYIEKPSYRVNVDLAFSEVDPARYDAVILPGGRAPEFIRNDPDVQRIVRHFLQTGKTVAAICHGPQVLTAMNEARGRRLAAYPPLKTDIENAGGTFVDEAVVVDGNVVSSRGWPDLSEFMRETVKMVSARQPVGV
jgi:protease I